MPGRRSYSGIGRISLIYTMGEDDSVTGTGANRKPEPVLTASIGEDFAECSWPMVLKCKPVVTQPDLLRYLDRLVGAVHAGFWMSPGSAQMVYWRWTGSVPPGMHPDQDSGRGTVDLDHALGTGRRSVVGAGPECGLYLMDEASRRGMDGFYGRFQGRTAISAAVGEDFALTHWPLVVKAHPEVTRERAVQYLGDLLTSVRNGFFVTVAPAGIYP
jgi:hypothetical protein